MNESLTINRSNLVCSRTCLLGKLYEDLSLETNKYLYCKSRMNSVDESFMDGRDKNLFKNMKTMLSKRSKSLIPCQSKNMALGNFMI